MKKMNLTSQLGPDDRIHVITDVSKTSNGEPNLIIEKITPPSFEESSGNFELSGKCKDNCVKDCACINHCSWGPLH